FSALKSVSRLKAGLPCPGAGLVAGGLVGAEGQSCVPCAKVGRANAETARNTSAAVATTRGNRAFMPINLFARGGAASDKIAEICRGDRGRKAGRGQFFGSALTGLEPALRLVNHIDAAFAPHDAIVAMAGAQRFK